MSADDLKEVLAKHRLYVRGDAGGERADLRWAHLRWAHLRGANLLDADLRWADPEGAIGLAAREEG